MKLFGAASIYFGANIINAAIPFLLLPILTRVLTPAEYGAVAMFTMMVSLFGAFTGLSVHGAVGIRYFQLSKNDFSDYVSSCIGILIISTAFTLLLLFIFQDWIISLSGLTIDWLVVAILISGAQFLINIRLSIWQVSDHAWHYGGLQISRSFIDAFLTLLLLLGLGMAWHGRLLGIVLSTVFISLVGTYWLFKEGKIRKPKIWRYHVQDALRFGLPLIPHTIGGMLILLIDRMLINKILGLDAVGIYMVAIQVGMIIGLIAESFNKAYAPWLYKQLEIRPNILNKKKIVKGTYLYFLIIILLSVTCGMAAPIILPILVGDKFTDASKLIIYTSLGFAFGGCYYMVVNYIFYSKKNEYLAILTFMVGLLNLPITYYMLTSMGVIGAAIAYMIINVIIFFGAWILASKVYRMPWVFWIRSKLV